MTTERLPVVSQAIQNVCPTPFPVKANRSETTILCDFFVDLAEILRGERQVVDAFLRTSEVETKRIYLSSLAPCLREAIMATIRGLQSRSRDFRFNITAIFSSGHFLECFQETFCGIEEFSEMLSEYRLILVHP